MKFRLGNKGGVDPGAWLVGIIGFTITFMVWVVFKPVVRDLINAGNNMNIGASALHLLVYINVLNDYAYVIVAGFWIIYIILSSIRQEVQERGYPMG